MEFLSSWRQKPVAWSTDEERNRVRTVRTESSDILVTGCIKRLSEDILDVKIYESDTVSRHWMPSRRRLQTLQMQISFRNLHGISAEYGSRAIGTVRAFPDDESGGGVDPPLPE